MEGFPFNARNSQVSIVTALHSAVSVVLVLSICGVQGCDAPESEPSTSAGFDIPETARAQIELRPPFFIHLKTTVGAIVIEARPELAPVSAARFRRLVESGFYERSRFHQVIAGNHVKFGLSVVPGENEKWPKFAKEEPRASNTRGTVGFVADGQPGLATRIYICLADLQQSGVVPFGKVVRGMENVDRVNGEHGKHPSDSGIWVNGLAYIESRFPDLDYVISAHVVDNPDDVVGAPVDGEQEETSDAAAGEASE